MIHLDLFSGIGGASIAVDEVFGKNNVTHIFVENDPFCQAVLKKHWPSSTFHGDIRQFNIDIENGIDIMKLCQDNVPTVKKSLEQTTPIGGKSASLSLQRNGSIEAQIGTRNIMRESGSRTQGSGSASWTGMEDVAPVAGEDEPSFLAIDHIGGGGTKERKEKAALTLYREIIKKNYPPQYQLLCHNCNYGKYRFKKCPHQK